MSSRMSAFRRAIAAPVAAVLAPVYLAACFHYVPVDSDVTPAPGTNVRATFASPTPFNLGTLTVNDVTALEGTVVETAPDSLDVWVKWLYPRVGDKYDANSTQFSLRRTSVEQLETWRMSGKRTAVLLGVGVAFVAGMLALVAWGKEHGGGGTSPGTKGGITPVTQVR